jgi:hypothetical protein
MESHPAAFGCRECINPSSIIVCSVPVYRAVDLNKPIHSIVDVDGALIVRFSVAMESHPAALVVVNV